MYELLFVFFFAISILAGFDKTTATLFAGFLSILFALERLESKIKKTLTDNSLLT